MSRQNQSFADAKLVKILNVPNTLYAVFLLILLPPDTKDCIDYLIFITIKLDAYGKNFS